MLTKESTKIERAKHRVEQIKNLYHHLLVFLIISAILILGKNSIGVMIFAEWAVQNPEVMNWVYWNAVLWLFILMIHTIFVFGKIPWRIKRWEQHQIQKYIKQDVLETKNT